MNISTRLRIPGPALSLMAFCIALNVSMGQIASLLKIPLYLDMVGTILCAVLAGPAPAMITAIAANILAAPLGSPSMIFFIPVGITVALVSSAWARVGAFRRWWTAIASGIVLGVISATVSAPIATFVFGGVTFAGTDLLVAVFRGAGFPLLQSVWLQGLTSDTIDKAISYSLVSSVIAGLPSRLLLRFRSRKDRPDVSMES
ncbi:MAG: hypothetical protein A2X67_14875 [Ignavibacteria bacterium GWA2_55_11]|nr:MAG: hypothetical protein A2X67_14875 [Ignavibacteria bacterium GWA2_55_11]OGU71407.1 MAG: hypothetical protein A3H45_02505 [Ignavibacteria bacterium RIFCSPLOWO2_02_FULL_55_14]